MFKMKTITLSLLALLLVMSFASCASDTASDSPLPSKDMKEIHERVGQLQDLKEVKMEMEENQESIMKMMSIPLPSYYINLIKKTCQKMKQQ